jgi:hypothetical protein
MYGEPPQYLTFTDQQHQILQNLSISENEPGAILHDFGFMLDFLRSKTIILTPSEQLPLNIVTQINERLKSPLKIGLKRPQHKSYPHIQGLYLLLRATGLAYVETSGKKPVLRFDEDLYTQWQSLNSSEQFGTLLEAWLLRGYPDLIGEDRRFMLDMPDNFNQIIHFLARYNLKVGLQVAGNRDVEDGIHYMLGKYNLGLLEMFGLFAIQSDIPEPGKGWNIKHIRLTPLGIALLSFLCIKFFKPDVLFTIIDQQTSDDMIGLLRDVLSPYLPHWKTDLRISQGTLRTGAHIFKVSLGDMWRRIAIDGKQNLDELAAAIIDSVEFDPDHLYDFSYRNFYGALETIRHSYMEESPTTSEMLIGDISLRIGQSMTFLFDFGDQWEFDVLLKSVEPDRVIKTPLILEAHGDSPEQYPDSDWDEDEYEDDYEDKGEDE